MRRATVFRNLIGFLIAFSAQSAQADDASTKDVLSGNIRDGSGVEARTEVKSSSVGVEELNAIKLCKWDAWVKEEPVVEYVDGKKVCTFRRSSNALPSTKIETSLDASKTGAEESLQYEHPMTRLDAFLSGRSNSYAGYDAETNF
jgi:hypothetical protein